MHEEVSMKATAPKKPGKSSKSERICAQSGCTSAPQTKGYCRLHYISNWKHIQFNNQVKAERRLNAYIDKVAKKYPKDYLEKIKEGLEDEGRFKEMAQELEIETQNEEVTDNEFLEKFMRVVKPGGE